LDPVNLHGSSRSDFNRLATSQMINISPELTVIAKPLFLFIFAAFMNLHRSNDAHSADHSPIAALALLLPFALPWSYDQIDWDAVRAPAFSGSHIFGTDEIGRDRLARLAAGTQVTLMVASAAALVSLIVGIAWAGGWMRR